MTFFEIGRDTVLIEEGNLKKDGLGPLSKL